MRRPRAPHRPRRTDRRRKASPSVFRDENNCTRAIVQGMAGITRAGQKAGSRSMPSSDRPFGFLNGSRLHLQRPVPSEGLEGLHRKNEGRDDQEDAHQSHEGVAYERLSLDITGQDLAQ
jgi:hypothetical protein